MKKHLLIRKLFFPVLIATTTPLGFVVACSNNEDNNKVSFHFKDFVAKYDNQKLFREGTIIKWFDGDTPLVSIKDPQTSKTSEISIRVASIDTPEFHDPNAHDAKKKGNIQPYEIEWAKKAKEWAEEEVPEGSKIKIYSDGTKSYDRLVGSIFYNKSGETGFNENFSVNIISAGFSFPLVSEDQVLNGYMNDWNIHHYISIPLYYAWKQAKQSKVELFGLSEQDLEKAYKMHGIPESDNEGLAKVEEFIDEWKAKDSFAKYNII